MTWTKQRHRLSILLVVPGLTLGMVSVSHAQRFVRPINSIPELVASNPNDPHTNVFIPQGPTGPGLFYQWRKNDGTTTNANQSVLGTDWPGASGRWHNIPIAQGSITGISNSGTNGFAVVNTLADLKNIPGNLGIGMVYIRGHSQAYDWGQGFFSRVDDCSVPDDDGLTSVHGNDALTCWTRENRFPWGGTPVQYAGGTVSIPLINTVQAYLATEGGGSVFIPPGSWPVASSTDGPILGYSNVEIVGGSSALLVGDGGGTMVNWTNVSNAGLIEVGISNVVDAIVIRGCTNILIGGNAISQVGDGVRQYGGDNVRIEHNIFSVVTNGVHFSLDGAVKVTGGSLIGNTFSGMLGSNVLEDAGSTDGYRRWDSGTEVRLAKTNSVIVFGTNALITGLSSDLVSVPRLQTTSGTATAPALAVETLDKGIYGTTNRLNFSTDGFFRLTIAADGIHMPTTEQISFDSGSSPGGTAQGKIFGGLPGSPEGGHTAPVGSLFLRRDGGAGTVMYLKESGVGNTGWVAYGAGGGGGTVAGSDTQVQFNDGGVFGADSDFVWDKTANTISLGGSIAFLPGATNLLFRSGKDLVYSNATTSSVGPFFRVADGSGFAGEFGNGGNVVQVKASGSSIAVELQDASSRSVRWVGNQLIPIQALSDLGSQSDTWQDLFLNRRLVWNGSTNTVWDLAGNGSPEGVVTADPGSIYRAFGGDIWRKATGTGSTGWVAMGDVVGPASATDNAIARFDSTTGKLIQNSTVIVSDAGALNAGNGSAALVTYGFASDPDTGMYRGGSGVLTWSVDGVDYINLNGNELELNAATVLGWGLGTTDLVLRRKGANNLQIGDNSASVPSAQIFQAGNGGGTDIPGGDLGIAGGQSTGAGTGGAVKLKTSPRTASSGSANSHVDRFIVAPEKVLTDAATSLFEIALPTLKATSGTIKWGIIVTDGTDVQAYGGVTVYSAVNKGGVYTKTVSTTAADTEAKAVSAGTLTATFSLLDGTNKLTMQVTPTGSLTETTYQIYFTLQNNSPQAITLL